MMVQKYNLVIYSEYFWHRSMEEHTVFQHIQLAMYIAPSYSPNLPVEHV